MQNAENKQCMDEETECLLAYIRKWEEENPGEEMVLITLPKHDKEERKRVLQAMIRFLGKEDFENRK